MLQPYNNKWPRLRWLWGLELAGCHACGRHCHVTSLGQCCASRLRGIHVYPSVFLGRDHTWCTLLLVTLHTNHSPIYTPSQLCSHKDDTVREAASPQYNIFSGVLVDNHRGGALYTSHRVGARPTLVPPPYIIMIPHLGLGECRQKHDGSFIPIQDHHGSD